MAFVVASSICHGGDVAFIEPSLCRGDDEAFIAASSLCRDDDVDHHISG